jgi:predicted RNase H-like HicB family nuclease
MASGLFSTRTEHLTEFPVNPEIITKNRDGRWLAEVIELPGVLTYGATKNEAIVKAETLALRVIAERLEQGEANPTSNQLTIE